MKLISSFIVFATVVFSIGCSIDISKLKINTEAVLSSHQIKQLKEGLDLKNLDSNDPFEQFQAWNQFVRENKLSNTPSVMSIATANEDGKPSNRIVALNGVDKRGFKFYTDTDNQLVSDLNSNPNAALVFYWESLARQVRVEGKVIRVAEEEMKSDFSKYSFETQLSFYINDHSSVVKNKQELLNQYENAFKKFHSFGSIQKSRNVVGYIVVPSSFEFYQTNDRELWILNDRIRYTKVESTSPYSVKGSNGWSIERLVP